MDSTQTQTTTSAKVTAGQETRITRRRTFMKLTAEEGPKKIRKGKPMQQIPRWCIPLSVIKDALHPKGVGRRARRRHGRQKKVAQKSKEKEGRASKKASSQKKRKTTKGAAQGEDPDETPLEDPPAALAIQGGRFSNAGSTPGLKKPTFKPKNNYKHNEVFVE